MEIGEYVNIVITINWEQEGKFDSLIDNKEQPIIIVLYE